MLPESGSTQAYLLATRVLAVPGPHHVPSGIDTRLTQNHPFRPRNALGSAP